MAAAAILCIGEPLSSSAAVPPVSITVISHNEEPGNGRPDYTADRNYYLQNRALLKSLAETITSRGATYNFQTDWNFLKAVALYDTGDVTANTGGKNIVRWMKENLGVEIDPHAHETQYNYADVAYLIEQLGVTPSKNVGGFLFSPADNPQGWEKHINGISGTVYPSYFWRADYLWGAATFLHQGTDDASSGVWRPKDRNNFYVNDPNQRLLYIGAGGGQVGLTNLFSDIQSGRAPADGFYTTSLFVVQDAMTTQSIAQLGTYIDSLAPKVAEGTVRWKTLSQMAELWTTTHQARPFRYDMSTRAVATYVTQTAESWVTAPNGSLLYTRTVQPTPSLYPGLRFPAVILTPGGTGAGAPQADNTDYRGLAASGFVVTAFNPEGRGSGQPGNLLSQGTENYNGFTSQNGFKAIIESVAAQSNVDTSNIGIESNSFGISIAAGALGRYPDLPVVYLVDKEGPHDSRVIAFYDAGHEVPIGGHLSTVTDPSPANVAFWTEREAVRYIGNFKGRYLRMQSETDHAQNPGYVRHAIEMINAATKSRYGGTGTARWTRMNGSDLDNTVNAVTPLANPAQYPVWITGRLSDHPGLNITYLREMSALVTQPFRIALEGTPNSNQLLVTGTESETYIIQSSTDLSNWSDLQTVGMTNDTQALPSNTNGFTHRFYRAVVAP